VPIYRLVGYNKTAMDIDAFGTLSSSTSSSTGSERKTPVIETPKEEKREAKTKTVTLEDIGKGLNEERLGASYLIDHHLKDELLKLLEDEYKCKVEKWEPIQDIFRRFLVCVLKGCLFKVSEILSLPEGVKLEVQTTEEKETDGGKIKKKKGKKKKKAAAKTKSDLILLE
jgi:hypothetical protein